MMMQVDGHFYMQLTLYSTHPLAVFTLSFIRLIAHCHSITACLGSPSSLIPSLLEPISTYSYTLRSNKWTIIQDTCMIHTSRPCRIIQPDACTTTTLMHPLPRHSHYPTQTQTPIHPHHPMTLNYSNYKLQNKNGRRM